MDPETRELASAAVEALQIMAANSSNRLGDLVGLIQCGLIGYGLWIMQKGNADRAEQVKYQQKHQEQQGTVLEQHSTVLEQHSTVLEQQGAMLADIGAALREQSAGIRELLRERGRRADS